MEKINLIAERTREEITNELSRFNDNGTLNYKVTRTDCDRYIELSVTPTDINLSFITSSALYIIQKVYESSEWKSRMFYGIVVKYDETSKENVPSLSIYIRK